MPRVRAEFLPRAIPTPAHDPSQPARPIPDIGLSIEAQFAAVGLAVSRLKTRTIQVAS